MQQYTLEPLMITEIQDFASEQTQALAARARKFSKGYVKSARGLAADSSEGLKQLRNPVRTVARAGVKLSAVSQTAVKSLIELEAEMLTAAMTDVAARLAKAARADGVAELVRGQAETLRETGERIVSDATRAVEIVTHAGHDIRTLAAHAYEGVVKAPAPAKTPRAPKARRTAGKAVAGKRAVRKTAARRRRKPVPASAWAM